MVILGYGVEDRSKVKDGFIESSVVRREMKNESRKKKEAATLGFFFFLFLPLFLRVLHGVIEGECEKWRGSLLGEEGKTLEGDRRERGERMSGKNKTIMRFFLFFISFLFFFYLI